MLSGDFLLLNLLRVHYLTRTSPVKFLPVPLCLYIFLYNATIFRRTHQLVTMILYVDYIIPNWTPLNPLILTSHEISVP